MDAKPAMSARDQKIRHDVEAELTWDPAINAAGIAVEVADGIVTLAGHLTGYAEKQSVEKAVQRVAGVRGLVMALEVRLPLARQRLDSEIARAAADALEWNGLVPHGSVKATVARGTITLSGMVDWDYQRAAAEAAVRPLLGVKDVSNRIAIHARMSPEIIRSRIEVALQRAALADAGAVRISAQDGTVTLAGTVHSLAERQLIAEAAWAAPGVSRVNNQLQVA